MVRFACCPDVEFPSTLNVDFNAQCPNIGTILPLRLSTEAG